MLIDSLSKERISESFSTGSYTRGHDYYRKNRVHDLLCYFINDIEAISSNVSGSNNYSVKIELTGRENNIKIKGNCSCPLGSHCKHIVATLLKALDRNLNATSAQKKAAPSPQHVRPIIKEALPTKPEPTQDPRIISWLKKIDDILSLKKSTQKNIDDSFSLRYILRISDNKLTLNLILARRLKSGFLGSEKAFREENYSHETHLMPIDTELLIKLNVACKMSGQYHSYYGYRMEGPHLEKLLPELIATDRCHFESIKSSPLKLGTTKKGNFNWEMGLDGFQTLQFSFSDSTKSAAAFVIEKLWYFKKETTEVGELETDLDANLIPLLLTAPKIPPEATQLVANTFMQQEKLISVAQPKLFSDKKIEKLKPIICLQLTQLNLKQYGYVDKQLQQTLEKKPAALLSFNYEGKIINCLEQGDIIRQIEGDQVTQYVRDKIIEKKAMDMLADHNLTLIGNIASLTRYVENLNFAHYFLIGHQSHDPLDFSAQVLPLLRAQGWQIETDADYPYQIVDEPIDEWYSSIDESSGYDWFNLELGITVKGEKINLLPVIQQLFKKINNQQFDISKNETVLAPLSDGRFIPLPIERVQNILNVLIELYDANSLANGDFLHLSKLQAARLLELEAAMGATELRWFGGEKIRALAQKLAQFSGIASVVIPKEFKGELRPYQQEGLNWLQFLREYEFGGILADDMGLGKTVQALSHLTVEKSAKRMTAPALIIAPTSLMFNWRMEAERFAPNLKVLVLHGSERKKNFSTIADYDLVLTTYPLLKHDKDILLKNSFHFLILDEAQCIKNSKSLSTQIVQQINAKHRLCLTGTPLENHLGELWSLFHFMMPGLLGNEKQFNQLFRTPIEKNGDQTRRIHLMRRIAPFMLRRTKNNVVKELPDKVHIIRQVEIEGAQRDLYETIRLTMQKKVRAEVAKLGLARSHIIILEALLKLRQVCCDPRLLKIDTAKKKKAKSAKLEFLINLIPELLEEGRRILLFSQFTGMLELIEDELNILKIRYVKLTGQTKDRATPVQQFQNGEIPLFLISLKAGGTGLNLTAADTVIHYDPWWNPAVEDQATDRAHRIGQNKTVFVYKLVTKGTVEEKILEMQQNKRALMEGLFSDNPSGKVKLTEKDLQGFFEPLAACEKSS